MTKPISQVSANELFPTLKALEKEGLDQSFISWVRKPGNAKDLAGWYKSRPGASQTNRIEIPKLTVRELLNRLKQGGVELVGPFNDLLAHADATVLFAPRESDPPIQEIVMHDFRGGDSMYTFSYFRNEERAYYRLGSYLFWLWRRSPVGAYAMFVVYPGFERAFGSRNGVIGFFYEHEEGQSPVLELDVDANYDWDDRPEYSMVAFRDSK